MDDIQQQRETATQEDEMRLRSQQGKNVHDTFKKVGVLWAVGVGWGLQKVPNQLVHAYSVPFNLHVIREAAPRASARVCSFASAIITYRIH